MIPTFYKKHFLGLRSPKKQEKDDIFFSDLKTIYEKERTRKHRREINRTFLVSKDERFIIFT